MKRSNIIILDFGSQYNQLIARRIREMQVYAEIVPYNASLSDIKSLNPAGIIFTGGPASVYEKEAPFPDSRIYNLGVPILGICYGMQVITHMFGGEVKSSKNQEYGKAIIHLEKESFLFKGMAKSQTVWMSHADHLTILPNGFQVIAKSSSSISVIENLDKKIYGLQFHPEVTHTQLGAKILNNFVFQICKSQRNWTMEGFVNKTIKNIQDKVGGKNVVLGLSGGVDSSVTAVLIKKAIGDQLTCIFVDNSLLRKNEAIQVMNTYSEYFHIKIILVDAKERFISKLVDVEDPEEKRKIIGKEFIKVFEEEANKLKGVSFLAQGTIYPDVIESQSVHGPSATIKSHHNVGGLPDNLKLELLEPIRYLFKDEVRRVGIELGIPGEMIFRHPFPGPGLAIRILGSVSNEKIKILQKADFILIEELHKNNLYNKVSQAFVVLLPVKSVGVMGDYRTYENTAVIRSANTKDFMTATWSKLPYEFLELVSNRIINEVNGINRVVYDISSKPPATIEWE